MNNAAQLLQTVHALVHSRCDRRALRALRYILSGYPLAGPLTDGWAELMTALENVRAFASGEVTPQQLRIVDECVRGIGRELAAGSETASVG
jgi:hypothetical protein